MSHLSLFISCDRPKFKCKHEMQTESNPNSDICLSGTCQDVLRKKWKMTCFLLFYDYRYQLSRFTPKHFFFVVFREIPFSLCHIYLDILMLLNFQHSQSLYFQFNSVPSFTCRIPGTHWLLWSLYLCLFSFLNLSSAIWHSSWRSSF